MNHEHGPWTWLLSGLGLLTGDTASRRLSDEGPVVRGLLRFWILRNSSRLPPWFEARVWARFVQEPIKGSLPLSAWIVMLVPLLLMLVFLVIDIPNHLLWGMLAGIFSVLVTNPVVECLAFWDSGALSTYRWMWREEMDRMTAHESLQYRHDSARMSARTRKIWSWRQR